jgi:hypothetical protein
MLPRVVQSRIPVLTSLRQTATSTIMFRRPPGTSTADMASQQPEDALMLLDAASTATTSRSPSPESIDLITTTSSPTLPTDLTHNRSGVQWDVAAHGCRTWLTARTLAQRPDANPAQIRALHIDAVRYMNMSLPQDLTPAEVELMRQDIPAKLITTATSTNNNIQQEPQIQPQTSTLRSGMAYVTCWVMAVSFFFIPIALTLLNKALVYERQHQLTERAFTNTLDLGTVLSVRGADLQRSFQRFRDGPVGGAVVNGSWWLAEGVAGGVIDGVRDAQVGRRQVQYA